MLGRRAEQRLKTYQHRILALDVIRHPELIPALESAVERANVDWWAWELKVKAEKDPERQEQIYRLGIQRYPDTVGLLLSFAKFLFNTGRNTIEAETLLRRVRDLDPTNALAQASLANAIIANKGSIDEAESLHKQALQLDPEDARIMLHYANFLCEERHNNDEAEKMFRSALNIDPENAIILINFADFSWLHLNNTEQAEEYYKSALEADDNEPNISANYAGFLLSKGRYKESLRLAERTLTINKSKPGGTTAEALFYIALIKSVLGYDDKQQLTQLKTLLNTGYRRGKWSFDPIMATAARVLPEEATDFYTSIAAAILDETRVDVLNNFECWNALGPTSPAPTTPH
ncbi:tetratricopeptide repeat protein [Sorangium sp. So ce1128]